MAISEEYRTYLIERSAGLVNVVKSINKLVTQPNKNDFYKERNIGTLEFAITDFLKKVTSEKDFLEDKSVNENKIIKQIAKVQMVIARDHIFGEGNKRTSFITAGLLLEFFANRKLEPDYTQEIEEFVVRLAGADREDHIDDSKVVVNWLMKNSTPKNGSEESLISIPHAMRMIDKIIQPSK